MRGQAEVLAEQLVGAVDEVDVHRSASVVDRYGFRPMRSHRGIAGLVAVAAVLATFVVACGDDGGDGDSTPHAVATFQVTEEHGETFKVELITQELIDNAQLLLDGEEAPKTFLWARLFAATPTASTCRGLGTFHPTTVEFADVTTEVCDGLPSDVEQDSITSPLYCPVEREGR